MTVSAEEKQATGIPCNATDVLLIDLLSESIELGSQNARAITEALRLLPDKRGNLWAKLQSSLLNSKS